MGKYLGLKKGGPYSGMVRFVRRSDTGSPLYKYLWRKLLQILMNVKAIHVKMEQVAQMMQLAILVGA